MSNSAFQLEKFIPRRWLRSGHAQTLAGNFLPRKNLLPAGQEERLFQVDAEARVLCHCHWQQGRAAAPTLLVLHGLEGSSDSQYVIGTGSKAWQAGMNVVRMNMRNCGGTEQLAPTLYHSGMSVDVAAVVRELIERDGLPQIFVAGFSMGGNLVLKMAGDLGRDAPPQLKAVAAVSPAMDLGASADALHEWPSRIYEWRFLWSLERRFRAKRRLFPDVYRRCARRSRSLRDFDDLITAPYCGFRNADDYYYRAAAARVLDRIVVPTLILHALDDPCIRITPETRAKIVANRNIMFCETENGGHCAYLASPNGYDGRWAERQVIEFFGSVASSSWPLGSARSHG